MYVLYSALYKGLAWSLLTLSFPLFGYAYGACDRIGAESGVTVHSFSVLVWLYGIRALRNAQTQEAKAKLLNILFAAIFLTLPLSWLTQYGTVIDPKPRLVQIAYHTTLEQLWTQAQIYRVKHESTGCPYKFQAWRICPVTAAIQQPEPNSLRQLCAFIAYVLGLPVSFIMQPIIQQLNKLPGSVL